MEFIVAAPELAKLLSLVSQLRSDYTVLNLVKDDLRVSTRSAVLGISGQLLVQGSCDGIVIVPSVALHSVVTAQGSRDLHIQSDTAASLVRLQAGKSLASLTLLSPEGRLAPDFSKFASMEAIVVGGTELVDGLAAVSPAMPTLSASHPQLEGVYFEAFKDHLRLVATDTNVLSYYDLSAVSEINGSVIIPSFILSEVRKRLPKTEVTIHWRSTGAHFSWPGFDMAGVLLEGTYPNYRSILPTDYRYSVSLNKAELAETIKRVTAITPADSSTTLTCQFGESLRLQLNGAESGSSVEEIAYSGDPPDFVLGFIPRKLREALRVTGGEEVVLRINAASQVVELFGEEHNRHFIMPLVLSKRELESLELHT